MAFQAAPVSLPQIAAATSEMWPAMANVLKAPWPRSSSKGAVTARQPTPTRVELQEDVIAPSLVQKANMPEYMVSNGEWNIPSESLARSIPTR